ncbi:hypothetical protein ABHF33_06705 [Chitinibacter sp. FCG-7]|uniref:Cache domain-containing protein n=1 Tax=Chitinibacter mangrovi TaxID=3153927 RepID=A0AAU7FEA4_9NEIS
MTLPNQKSIFRNLGFKRFLLMLFIGLQVFSVAIYLAVSRQQLEINVAKTLENTAVLLASQYQSFNELMGLQLQLLATKNGQGHIDQPSLQRALEKDWLDAVFIIDKTGKIVSHASLIPLNRVLSADILSGMSFEKHPIFQGLKQQNAEQQLVFWRKAKNTNDALLFHQSVKGPQGEYLGSIVGMLSSRTMDRIFQKNVANGLTLSDHEAFVIYNSSEKTLLYLYGAGMNATLGDKYALQGTTASPFSEAVKYYHSPIDGQRRLGAFKSLQQGHWTLLMSVQPKEYLLGWWIQVVISMVTLSLMALMQWLLLNSFHRNQMQRDRLAHDSLHDPLTQLPNRRHFDQWAEAVPLVRQNAICSHLLCWR